MTNPDWVDPVVDPTRAGHAPLREGAVHVGLALAALALLAAGVVYALDHITRRQQNAVRESIETVLATTHQGLKTWSREQRLIAESLASDPVVIEATQELLRAERLPEVLLRSTGQKQLRAMLYDSIEARGYEGFFVIAPDGVSLASSRDTNVGTLNLIAESLHFRSTVRGGHSAVSPTVPSDVPLPGNSGELVEGRPTMFVTAPIRDDSGGPIAWLALRIDPRRDYMRILASGRLGRTGETYSFNSRGLLMSPSRFDDQLRRQGLIRPEEDAWLTLRLIDPGHPRAADVDGEGQLTAMAASAVRGEAGVDIRGYRDYRGVRVVGAWTWDAELGLGLTTEMDVEDAYEALDAARATVVLLGTLAGMLIVTLAVVFRISRNRALRAAQLAAERDAAEVRARAESMRMLNDELEHRVAEQTEELRRSNKELEQYAYVTSHDLQEPLRMVASYMQLLKQRYGRQLDEDAREFIEYAVDGATRMKALIRDLLEYSRIGKGTDTPAAADANGVVENVLRDLQVAIAESGAEIERDDLPVVEADEHQLHTLFQNLIGNAIKYRGEEPPRIRVKCEPVEGAWQFSVADNGIGIKTEYAEHVFELFRRLHSPAEYSGTGIGLAICKKIVEGYGGRIWVERAGNSGSNFIFTVPRLASAKHVA